MNQGGAEGISLHPAEMSLKLLLLALCFAVACGKTVTRVKTVPVPRRPAPESDQDYHMHRSTVPKTLTSSKYSDEENDARFWAVNGEVTLLHHLSRQQITTPAKNIIFFIGDGMSVPTLAAARIYMGQQQGYNGEQWRLAFEDLPYTGMSKTYCVDAQVSDSACTATAFLTGVKANQATVGVTGRVTESNCTAENIPENRLDSIIAWAQAAGKHTGVVTTTRVTHATPAAAYARSSNRDWEDDFMVDRDGWDPAVCIDIAKQLVTTEPGKNINVILGGGRRHFRPWNIRDEERASGSRLQGSEDLIELWRSDKKAAKQRAAYVWNRSDLLAVDPNNTDFLLGLFEASHCKYHLDADAVLDPSLAEMTETAIKMLERGPKGYFLFVEGGRIDHAHHDTKAVKALDETVQLSQAVDTAVRLTNERDTLIVVTSDHSHAMTFNGYPARGNPIFAATELGSDNLTYATLSYANGPGFKVNVKGTRRNLTKDDLTDKDYKYPSMILLDKETHGGDDVVVFASGPWAHLFTGTYEQSFIPHVMAYAACIGHGNVDACSRSGNRALSPTFMMITVTVIATTLS